ncbi:hypothetical protein P3342_002859 [Pyrenophora teres f. teres]|nr:hypothetical protein P3342_002859 [Pyrenophora teres f. teres]
MELAATTDRASSLISYHVRPSLYANFTPSMQQQQQQQQHIRQPTRHHSIATSRVISTATNTPPPSRPQVAGAMVKAQPAFKPTWQGFLDTTKDAMTVVEAALQGRLSHISRRPHDKERAEMLTSGTVLVYEENASGIKRWTDAVHWSPSRVMNNCLIYRQLVRALKPEEKKSALNPSCGTKRKRKESNGPARSKTGEVLENSEDEYENPSFDPSADADSMNKVYANFAQSLTPDQQRRFCGSLIDSYEFKEGGLMKKTISVKYQGTHHHVISYYSLEDVVSGKLKRPFQDPKLADIQPRPELLNGWKVSLEDEESKDMPLVAGYPHHIQPSHVQHHVIGAVTQAVGPQGIMQTHAPLHLTVPDYWHGTQVSQYGSSHHSPQHYAASQPAASQYSAPQPSQYPVQQPSPQPYASQQHYTQPSSPQPYSHPIRQAHSTPHKVPPHRIMRRTHNLLVTTRSTRAQPRQPHRLPSMHRPNSTKRHRPPHTRWHRLEALRHTPCLHRAHPQPNKQVKFQCPSMTNRGGRRLLSTCSPLLKHSSRQLLILTHTMSPIKSTFQSKSTRQTHTRATKSLLGRHVLLISKHNQQNPSFPSARR